MSLMEILVGSLMFAIVAITVAAVIAPMMMAFSRANNFAEYNTMLDSVGNQIVSDIARSTAAPVAGDSVVAITINSDSDVVYTVEDGVLMRNGVPVFSEGFNRGKTISFIVTEDTLNNGVGYSVAVTVTSGSETGMTIERPYAVRPLMLNQESENAP